MIAVTGIAQLEFDEVLDGPMAYVVRYNSGAGTVTLTARRVSVDRLFLIR